MENFIRDRHKAFEDVLTKDSYKALDKYCKKYKVPKPKSRKVQKAGVLKAIQYCNDFTEEQKTFAMQKCLDMGFNPLFKDF